MTATERHRLLQGIDTLEEAVKQPETDPAAWLVTEDEMDRYRKEGGHEGGVRLPDTLPA